MYFRIAIVKYVDDRRELVLHSLFNEIMLFLYGHGMEHTQHGGGKTGNTATSLFLRVSTQHVQILR